MMMLRVVYGVALFVWCLCGDGAEGYRNYSVGDSLGWYAGQLVDYQKWAASYSFSLGDFLLFNTDNNHSVIQTYNFTTFSSCDYADASDPDTIQWSAAIPSSTAVHPISVAVPLLKLGMTYFFSGNYDGEQCLNGQRFKINVTLGQGLPPSLRQPPPEEAPSPVAAESGGEVTVPENFDNPKDVGDDGDPPPASNWAPSGAFFDLLILGFVGFIYLGLIEFI